MRWSNCLSVTAISCLIDSVPLLVCLIWHGDIRARRMKVQDMIYRGQMYGEYYHLVQGKENLQQWRHQQALWKVGRFSTRSGMVGAAADADSSLETTGKRCWRSGKNTYQISTQWKEKHQDKGRGHGADRPNILSTIGWWIQLCLTEKLTMCTTLGVADCWVPPTQLIS